MGWCFVYDFFAGWLQFSLQMQSRRLEASMKASPPEPLPSKHSDWVQESTVWSLRLLDIRSFSNRDSKKLRLLDLSGFSAAGLSLACPNLWGNDYNKYYHHHYYYYYLHHYFS